MEKFEFNFKNSLPQNYKTQRILFLILGLVYIANGINDYYEKSQSDFFFVIWIVTGILMLIGTFIDKRLTERYHLSIDDDKISASLAFTQKIDVKWSELSSIGLKPIAIVFTFDNGSKQELSLSQLSYNDVKLVKQKFTEFAKFKNVEIN